MENKRILGTLPTFRGQWSAEETYYYNNIVEYGEDAAWVCAADSTTAEPGTSDDWRVFVRSKSAYDYAVQQGYTGTKEEYYAELSHVGEAASVALLMSDMAEGKEKIAAAISGHDVEASPADTFTELSGKITNDLMPVMETPVDFGVLGYDDADRRWLQKYIEEQEEELRGITTVEEFKDYFHCDDNSKRKHPLFLPKGIVLTDESVEPYNAFFDYTWPVSFVPLLSLPNVGDLVGTFNFVSLLVYIVLDIPKVVNAGNAFELCQNLKYARLQIGSKLIVLGSAFDDCVELEEVDIVNSEGETPSPIFDLGDALFGWCKRLKRVNLEGLDFTKIKLIYGVFHTCESLPYIPALDTRSATSFYQTFFGCKSLERIESLSLHSATSWSRVFDLAWEDDTDIHPLKYMVVEGLGISGGFDFGRLDQWGAGGEENRQSLVKSIVQNTYDRQSAGLEAAEIRLSSGSFALLTDEEKAAVVAKGYTLVY